MSFLLKKRIFFLFVFFFLCFYAPVTQATIQTHGYDPRTGSVDTVRTGTLKYDQLSDAQKKQYDRLVADGLTSNQALDQLSDLSTHIAEAKTEAAEIERSQKKSDLAEWVMDFVQGLIAGALPLAAAFTIPFSFIAFGISSLVLGISSYLIDIALEVGVNLMSQIVNSKANSVKTSWEIFRNIANIGIRE